MHKIVLTDKYLDVMMAQFTDTKKSFKKTNLALIEESKLKNLCQTINVSFDGIKKNYSVDNSLYEKTIMERPNQRIEKVTTVYGKSVNKVLGELIPSEKFPKNSKLSNYKIDNLLKLKHDSSQKIRNLLKKSVDDELHKRNQIVNILQKGKLNSQKVKQRLSLAKQLLKDTIEKRKENVEKLPKWKDINDEFLKRHEGRKSFLKQRSTEVEECYNSKDKSSAFKLFNRYENNWKRFKDFSQKNIKLCNIVLPDKKRSTLGSTHND